MGLTGMVMKDLWLSLKLLDSTLQPLVQDQDRLQRSIPDK